MSSRLQGEPVKHGRAHRAAGPRLPARPPDVRASPTAGSARPRRCSSHGGRERGPSGHHHFENLAAETMSSDFQNTVSVLPSWGSGRQGSGVYVRGRGREACRHGCVRVLSLLVTWWQLGRAWPAVGPASLRIGRVGRSLNGAPLAASGPAAAGPPCAHAGEASHPCCWPPAPPTQPASKRQLSFAVCGETRWMRRSGLDCLSPAQCWAWSVFGETLCGVLEDLARCRMQG